MFFNVAVVTVILAVGEVTPFNVAVIVVLPSASPETTPLPLTAAVPDAAETQVTCAVRLAVEPSVYVPTAPRIAVSPCVTVREFGVTAILFNVTGVLPPPPHPESSTSEMIEKAASSNLV
jgi:hypothetical protein